LANEGKSSTATTPTRSGWVCAPDVAVARWHVGPRIDVLAYALSWLWALIPLMAMGNSRAEYIGAFVVIVIVSDLHRHFSLPYIYLDAQVRRRYRVRFVALPMLLFGLWWGTPYFRRLGPSLTVVGVLGVVALGVVVVQIMRRDTDGELPPWRRLSTVAVLFAAAVLLVVVADVGVDRGWVWLGVAVIASVAIDAVWSRPETRRARRLWLFAAIALSMVAATRLPPQSVRPPDLISGAIIVTGAWNIWHVLMQKYGILRLYNAKSGRAEKVPGWVDRLLLFAWIPLFLIWLGPANRYEVLSAYRAGRRTMIPIIDGMEAVQPYLLAPSVALVVVAVGLFLYYEWRTTRLTNAPRLWLAGGTTLLSAAFFFVHPLKVYLAYGFSHAVEYMVFVWAFQRRRYARPTEHKAVLARVLRHPVLAYGGFVLVGGLLIFVLEFYGHAVLRGHKRPYLLGFTTAEWFIYWGMYQSVAHFYFDSFLWKMRSATTRAHI